MKSNLTIEDLDFILESLKYTKLKFEDYEKYPSYEYKQQKLDHVNGVSAKVAIFKEELKNATR